MKILQDKVFGVDKHDVLDTCKLSEVATSACIKEGKDGAYVCFFLTEANGGGAVNASARGSIKEMPVGSEVPVATATLQLVQNRETGKQSYRVL